MKRAFLLILAGIIGGEFSALADVEQASKLTPLQKQQIAWAIKILADTKALTVKQNQCVQFDEDILSVLEAEGQIDRGGAQPDSICVGAGGFTK
ncbi:MAG: hypothetical protein JNM39_07435 [Bdellovibrionaceae bacterium]|nr:hypothetical protein [Pseudobdellovibrionaceae bacterium]